MSRLLTRFWNRLIVAVITGVILINHFCTIKFTRRCWLIHSSWVSEQICSRGPLLVSLTTSWTSYYTSLDWEVIKPAFVKHNHDKTGLYHFCCIHVVPRITVITRRQHKVYMPVTFSHLLQHQNAYIYGLLLIGKYLNITWIHIYILMQKY